MFTTLLTPAKAPKEQGCARLPAFVPDLERTKILHVERCIVCLFNEARISEFEFAFLVVIFISQTCIGNRLLQI